MRPSEQEWLETDGLGGFASSTTGGVNTRRYHGLLFLSGRDPGDRFLAVSKLEDRFEDGDSFWELSSNVYPGAFHPDGAKNLVEFRRYPFPSFLYRVGKRLITKEVFMAYGMQGVFCVYRLRGEVRDSSRPILRIRPLLNNRYYHHTGREGTWTPQVLPLDGAVVIRGHCRGPLLLSCTGSSFRLEPVWYRNMLYPRERERGLDYSEDHFCPGEFLAPFGSGKEVVVWMGPLGDEECVGERTAGLGGLYAASRANEEARRVEVSGGDPGLSGKLALAADQFIVKGTRGTSIIAGYHWFGEWGRDSFISLPGLCFSYGRFQDAKEVFTRFAEAMRNGLIPNCFWEGTQAAYNAVDASLWMVEALSSYERATKDFRFVDSMLPAVREIVRYYAAGTSYGVRMEPSGLLWAGDDCTQVTWMDACVRGAPVTGRAGMPVEVNALWISALFALAKWEKRLGTGDWGPLQDLAVSAAKEFIRLFTWPGVGLYDRVCEEGPSQDVRPNQVLAASILGDVLPVKTLQTVFQTATRSLVTPTGLRTLDPASPGYVGEYRGGPEERDRAYHQGAAWPFLSWPYLELSRKAYPDMPRSALAEVISKSTAGFMDLDANPCVGSVFEVSSGDPPHSPGGAVAQAWSVSAAVKAHELSASCEANREEG